jgi:hypothetical protein
VFPRLASSLVVLAFACSDLRASTPNPSAPGVVIPNHLAEGHGEEVPAELPSASPPLAGSSAPQTIGPPRPFTSDPPDPTPLRQTDQYEYTFHYERGTVELVGVHPVRYPKPIVTARRIGRFAVELWIGHELIDRVRFDFPLLAADEPKTGPRSIGEGPDMEHGSFTTTVLVPAARRARSARLVDRALRLQSELPWPPAPAGLGPAQPMAASGTGAGTSESAAEAPAQPSSPDAAAAPNRAATTSNGAVPPNSAGTTPNAAATAPNAAATAPNPTPPSSAAPAAAPPARAHPR